jgi:serine/threonine protein kinase
MSIAPGTRLAPCQIESAIGAGGMGEVYKARDSRLDRSVAIKALPPDVASDPGRRQRFEREARSIAQLTHPHICALYDVGESDLPSTEPRVPFDSAQGRPSTVAVSYLVMEYLEGETLATRLDRGAVTLEQALRLGAEIADALGHAHRSGIIHRDLKPGNVMLTKAGVKLLDFGLARIVAATGLGASQTRTETLTDEGRVLGTAPCMAPEQIEGKEADARTDIFALGCVLYELVTGRPAFEGTSSASVMSAILKDEPPPVFDAAADDAAECGSAGAPVPRQSA